MSLAAARRPRLARHDQTLGRFVHHADAGYGARHGARVIGARVVDDDDFVGRPRLGQQGIETGRKESGFVVGADDRGTVEGLVDRSVLVRPERR